MTAESRARRDAEIQIAAAIASVGHARNEIDRDRLPVKVVKNVDQAYKSLLDAWEVVRRG